MKASGLVLVAVPKWGVVLRLAWVQVLVVALGPGWVLVVVPNWVADLKRVLVVKLAWVAV
jgi:hypothetical protein